ncbi:MAG TPA: acyltransferase [Rhodanobacteraceae bacterium]|nr:acyltransferase [Rhodanobacteraceae bacterium]
MQSREDRRLRYVDSLRAIAAMLVLWVHVSEKFKDIAAPGSDWVHALTVPINAGRIGVVTFFAISGFVIPFSIKLAHGHPVREFLVTRFFRLYPAYWLSIPFGILTTYWLWNGRFPMSAILVNFTMVEDLFGVPPAIGLYWTLAVEIVFYLCCVVLVLTGSITRYRLIGAVAALLVLLHAIVVPVLAALHSVGWYGPSLWAMHIGIMFWGTLYRAQMLGLATSAFERMCLWGTAFVVIVVYPLLYARIGVAYMHTIDYSIGILIFIVGTRLVRLGFAPLPWLGLISYSIYLFHPVVFNSLLWIAQTMPSAAWLRGWHLAWYVVVVLLLTIAFAALVYYLVERPSIRLGRRLAKRWFGDGEPASPQPVATLA